MPGGRVPGSFTRACFCHCLKKHAGTKLHSLWSMPQSAITIKKQCENGYSHEFHLEWHWEKYFSTEQKHYSAGFKLCIAWFYLFLWRRFLASFPPCREPPPTLGIDAENQSKILHWQLTYLQIFILKPSLSTWILPYPVCSQRHSLVHCGSLTSPTPQ